MLYKKYLLLHFLVFLYCVFNIVNAHAIEVQVANVEQKEVIKTNWGSKKGEIGEAPIDPQDQTYGGSINPIAVDSKGNIYVGDSVNNRIQKFGANGKFLLKITFEEGVGWAVINDIAIDKDDNVFVAFYYDTRIRKYDSTGKLISIINLGDAETLEMEKNGNEKGIFHINRLLVDNNGNIYVLGSNRNLLKVNKKGGIIQRWQDATNAMNFLFIDKQDNLYIWDWISPYKRFDKNGNFIGTGLGRYENIIIPFYFDKYGNVYGFAPHPDNSLVMYTIEGNRLLKFPIKYNDLFDEWTVDSKGNIYYTDTGGYFRVIKMSILPSAKEDMPKPAK